MEFGLALFLQTLFAGGLIIAMVLMRLRRAYSLQSAMSITTVVIGGAGIIGATALAEGMLRASVSLIGAALMAIGATGLVKATSRAWMAVTLDHMVLASGLGLVADATVSLVVQDRHSTEYVVDMGTAWCVVLMASSLLSFINAQRQLNMLQIISIRIFAIGAGSAKLVEMARYADVPWASQASQGLVFVATAGLAVYAACGFKNKNIPSSSVEEWGKFHSWILAVGLVGTALTQYSTIRNGLSAGLVTIALLNVFLFGLVVRTAAMVVYLRRVRRESADNAEYYKALVDNSGDVVVVCDVEYGNIVQISGIAEKIVGQCEKSLIGQHAAAVMGVRSSVANAALARAVGGELNVRIEGMHGDVAVESVIRLVGANILCTVRDVSERNSLRKSLHYLAYVDEVTGLPNRNSTLDRITASLEKVESSTVVLMIGIDRFKQVNDSAGRELGDEVLGELARRFEALLQPGDLLARLGGDEFVVVSNVEGVDATSLAEAVGATAAVPITVGHYTFQLGASVGSVVSSVEGEPLPDGCAGVSELLRRADVAMYRAKRDRVRHVAYSPVLSQDVRDTVDRDALMMQVLKEKQLAIALQPIVDLQTLDVLGAEALLRWKSEDGSIQGPFHVLDFAHRTGQMSTVTEWVMNEVSRVLAEVPQIPRISMNVSPSDLLDPFLPDRILSCLARHQVDPSRLVVEIVEDEMIAEAHRKSDVLTQLRTMGIKVLIDDFGSGYSSLGYLAGLPISGFKLDRTFLVALEEGSNAVAVIRSMSEFAQAASLDMVVEGVETELHHSLLRRLTTGAGQGFLYAKPEIIVPRDSSPTLDWWTERTAESLGQLREVHESSIPQQRTSGDNVVPFSREA